MAANFCPRRELREKTLERALKTYIVPPFCRKYQVIALRALWNMESSEENVIWGKRIAMENILDGNLHVVAFFSCITAMQSKGNKKRKRNDSDSEGNESNECLTAPGLAFWIVFDWPEHALSAFENIIEKNFMEAGLDIDRCAVIRPRGTFSNIFINIFVTTDFQVVILSVNLLYKVVACVILLKLC